MVVKRSLIDRVIALEDSVFFTKKAGGFSGVPPRTIQSWTERGLIAPDIANTSGTGSKRQYGIRNCIEIGIVKSLTDNRLALKMVDEIMSHLKSKGGRDREKKVSPKLEEVLTARAGYLIVRIHRSAVVGFTTHVSHFVSHQIFDISSHPKWDKTLIIDIKRIAERVIEAVETQ